MANLNQSQQQAQAARRAEGPDAEEFPLSASTAEIFTKLRETPEAFLGDFASCLYLVVDHESQCCIDGDNNYENLEERLLTKYGENWDLTVVLIDNPLKRKI